MSHVKRQHSQLASEVGAKLVTTVPPRVSQECPGLQPRSPDSLPDLGVWAGVHSIRPGSGETPWLSPPLGAAGWAGRTCGLTLLVPLREPVGVLNKQHLVCSGSEQWNWVEGGEPLLAYLSQNA